MLPLAVLLLVTVLLSTAQADHGLTELVSTGPAGGNGPNAAYYDAITTDGSRTFFETDEKLVTGDTDVRFDVYERAGGNTTLISIGPNGGNGDNDVYFGGISADGSRVFFETDEKLINGDNDGMFDVYERSGGATTLISGGNGNFDAFFDDTSADGTHVFFDTDERLAGTDTDDSTDVYERSGGTLSHVSIGGNGAFFASFVGTSQDGSRVFFETAEPLVAADDLDAATDVYERSGGATTLISRGASPSAEEIPALFEGASQDGSRVFFLTAEQVDGGDTDNSNDIYQRSGGTTTQISTGPAGGNGAFSVTFGGSSADGTRVFFRTQEKLVLPDDGDSSSDVYQRSGGTTTLVSTGSIGGNGANTASFDGNSADGLRVFFSTAEKLEASDTDSSSDVYERSGGTTKHVSLGGNAALPAFFVGSSEDGSRVFLETSEKLSTQDTDNSNDVYERHAGATTVLSIGVGTGNGTQSAFFDGASANGARVAFDTRESLTGGDSDTVSDIYQALVSYPRPNGAAKVRVTLAPAMLACTAPNTSHGSPLSNGSCSPVAQASAHLTVPNDDSSLANASMTLRTFCSNAETPPCAAAGEQEDVRLIAAANDVRKRSDGTDYAGQLEARVGLRVTDRYSGGGLDSPATVADTSFSFAIPCTTNGTPVGSSCSTNTTANAVTPGLVKENKRAIWEFDQIEVYDGGPDGLASTQSGNTVFLRQAVFVP